MLTIHHISADDQEDVDYYENDESLAQSQDEYYGNAECESQTGKLTQAVWDYNLGGDFKPQGAVLQEDFKQLFHGSIPQTNEALRLKKQNPNDQNILGIDFTYSVPKSVSIQLHRGKDDRIFDVIMQAGLECNQILRDRYLCTRIQKNGVRRSVKTNNAAIVMIPHHTSRDGDMQTHLHAVLMGGTRGPDGILRSLDDFAIKKSQIRSLGNIFENKVAAGLQKLGYELEFTAKGWEIKGYTREDILTYSKRSRAMSKYLEEKGLLPTSEHKQEAVLRTRKAKNIELSLEQMREAWSYESDVVPQVPKDSPVERIGNPSARAELDSAIRHLSERRVAFEREQIEQYVFRRPKGFDEVELEQAISEHPSLLRVDAGRLTTVEALEREVESIQRWMAGQGQAQPLKAKVNLEGTLLNSGQAEAVLKTLTSTDRHQIWLGFSGTGKTTAFKAVKEELDGSKVVIRGFATTVEAAETLGKELGIQTHTVQHQVLTQPEKLPNQLWIVDEVGMLGAEDMVKLQRQADLVGARLLIGGDSGQNPSIKAGSPLRSLMNHGAKTYRLSEIIRQQNDIQKQAVELIENGDGVGAVRLLNEKGYIVEIADPNERAKAVTQQYLGLSQRERDQTRLVAGTNVECLRITQALRSGLKDEGQLSKSVKVVKLVSWQFTEEEKRRIENYSQGDYIQLRRDYPGTSLQRGQLYKVEKRVGNELVVSSYGGRMYRIDPSKQKDKDVYYAKSIEIAVGDRLRWTVGDKQKGRTNGRHLTVSAINETSLTVQDVKTKKTHEVSLLQPLAVDYDWVSTSYKVQGSTYKATIGSTTNDPTSSREALTVTISRQKHELTLYTEDLKQLERWANRSNAQENPLDLIGENYGTTTTTRHAADIEPAPPALGGDAAPESGIAAAVTRNEGAAQQRIEHNPNLGPRGDAGIHSPIQGGARQSEAVRDGGIHQVPGQSHGSPRSQTRQLGANPRPGGLIRGDGSRRNQGFQKSATQKRFSKVDEQLASPRYEGLAGLAETDTVARGNLSLFEGPILDRLEHLMDRLQQYLAQMPKPAYEGMAELTEDDRAQVVEAQLLDSDVFTRLESLGQRLEAGLGQKPSPAIEGMTALARSDREEQDVQQFAESDVRERLESLAQRIDAALSKSKAQPYQGLGELVAMETEDQNVQLILESTLIQRAESLVGKIESTIGVHHDEINSLSPSTRINENTEQLGEHHVRQNSSRESTRPTARRDTGVGHDGRDSGNGPRRLDLPAFATAYEQTRWVAGRNRESGEELGHEFQGGQERPVSSTGENWGVNPAESSQPEPANRFTEGTGQESRSVDRLQGIADAIVRARIEGELAEPIARLMAQLDELAQLKKQTKIMQASISAKLGQYLSQAKVEVLDTTLTEWRSLRSEADPLQLPARAVAPSEVAELSELLENYPAQKAVEFAMEQLHQASVVMQKKSPLETDVNVSTGDIVSDDRKVNVSVPQPRQKTTPKPRPPQARPIKKSSSETEPPVSSKDKERRSSSKKGLLRRHGMDSVPTAHVNTTLRPRPRKSTAPPAPVALASLSHSPSQPVRLNRLSRPMKQSAITAFWEPDYTGISQPQQLEPHHWDEMKRSAIHPDLIALNIQSLEGQPVLERLLEEKLEKLGGEANQYTTAEVKRIVQPYERVAEGGWWGTAGIEAKSLIDLQPGDKPRQSLWGVFKPDKPILEVRKPLIRHRYNPTELDKTEKLTRQNTESFAVAMLMASGINSNKFIEYRARKYENPAGTERHLYLPNVSDEIAQQVYDKHNIQPTEAEKQSGFWAVVSNHPEIPIVVTEGFKKTLASISQDEFTIGLAGVNALYRARDNDKEKLPQRVLNDEMAIFATPGRSITFAFDSDARLSTVFNVRAELVRGVELLEAQGSTVKVAKWKPELGKGLDDLIANQGPSAYLLALAKAESAEKEKRIYYRTQYNALAKEVRKQQPGISGDALDIEVYLLAIERGEPKDGERFLSQSDHARTLKTPQEITAYIAHIKDQVPQYLQQQREVAAAQLQQATDRAEYEVLAQRVRKTPVQLSELVVDMQVFLIAEQEGKPGDGDRLIAQSDHARSLATQQETQAYVTQIRTEAPPWFKQAMNANSAKVNRETYERLSQQVIQTLGDIPTEQRDIEVFLKANDHGFNTEGILTQSDHAQTLQTPDQVAVYIQHVLASAPGYLQQRQDLEAAQVAARKQQANDRAEYVRLAQEVTEVFGNVTPKQVDTEVLIRSGEDGNRILAQSDHARALPNVGQVQQYIESIRAAIPEYQQTQAAKALYHELASEIEQSQGVLMPYRLDFEIHFQALQRGDIRDFDQLLMNSPVTQSLAEANPQEAQRYVKGIQELATMYKSLRRMPHQDIVNRDIPKLIHKKLLDPEVIQRLKEEEELRKQQQRQQGRQQ